MEISYSKDNTRRIIEAVKENKPDQNINHQLSEALSTYNHIAETNTSDQDIKASETGWSLEDKAEPEADNLTDRAEDTQKKVTPLYEDPNKKLSADEIAKLFASYGN